MDNQIVDIPKRIGKDKYGLRELKVGDSKFFPMCLDEVPRMQRRLISAAKSRSIKLVTRATVEDDVAGMRIWRTE